MNYLRIIHNILCQLGFNLLKIKNLIYTPLYIKSFFIFKKRLKSKNLKIKNYFFPVLGEHLEKSSKVIEHYFNQDLLVASYIFKNKPKKHVDVGSRIDGFVAHVASFRNIEVFDIRNNDFQFKNITFKKKDISKVNKNLINYCDSLSCLHTLEHFGLGRYGDKIDPEGHIKGFKNLIKILKKNGTLYVSVPISDQNAVYFNSERLFKPKEILKWSNDVKLTRFDLINDNNQMFLNLNVKNFKKKIKYSCGIYTFKKK